MTWSAFVCMMVCGTDKSNLVSGNTQQGNYVKNVYVVLRRSVFAISASFGNSLNDRNRTIPCTKLPTCQQFVATVISLNHVQNSYC